MRALRRRLHRQEDLIVRGKSRSDPIRAPVGQAVLLPDVGDGREQRFAVFRSDPEHTGLQVAGRRGQQLPGSAERQRRHRGGMREQRAEVLLFATVPHAGPLRPSPGQASAVPAEGQNGDLAVRRDLLHGLEGRR